MKPKMPGFPTRTVGPAHCAGQPGATKPENPRPTLKNRGWGTLRELGMEEKPKTQVQKANLGHPQTNKKGAGMKASATGREDAGATQKEGPRTQTEVYATGARSGGRGGGGGGKEGDAAAGAVHLDGVAIFQGGHAIANGHDGRNLHFASGDGAVRERAAGFGDDGDGVVEERGPGGIGGASDEDGAFGEGGEVVHAADEIHGAGGLAGAAGETREVVARDPRPVIRGGDGSRRCRAEARRYIGGWRRATGSGGVEKPGGGLLAIAEIGFFFGADRIAEGAPNFVVVGLNGFFEIGRVSEEDVHGLGDNAADVKAAAEFAQTFAERESEAGGLVVLEIVEAGVGTSEADEFVEKEMERGGEAREEFEFGLVHAHAEFVFALGGRAKRGRNSRSLGRKRLSG